MTHNIHKNYRGNREEKPTTGSTWESVANWKRPDFSCWISSVFCFKLSCRGTCSLYRAHRKGKRMNVFVAALVLSPVVSPVVLHNWPMAGKQLIEWKSQKRHCIELLLQHSEVSTVAGCCGDAVVKCSAVHKLRIAQTVEPCLSQPRDVVVKCSCSAAMYTGQLCEPRDQCSTEKKSKWREMG